MARVALGVMGAILAAVLRGVVGIARYRVQTYLASEAVQVLVVTLALTAESLTHSSIVGRSTLAWISFIFVRFFQLVIIPSGTERIRRLIDFCRPTVYLVMLVLPIWLLWQAGASSLSLQSSRPASSTVATLGVMANAAMLIVAYSAALRLNFGDFARFGKDEAAMKAGTLKVFGQAIMDPVLIAEKIGNPFVVVPGSVPFIVATMGINIVASFVSPA